MIKFFKEHKLITITIILYIITFIIKRPAFFYGLQMTKGFLIEMVEILPPILVISALITVWVPSEVIVKTFGKGSGVKGKLLALITGAVSAGPIYAAFPVAETLFLKGASVSNIVIIISSWAVIKVVMFMVESSFLGFTFASTRYLLTIPAIFIMAFVMEKLVSRKDVIEGRAAANITEEYKNVKEVLIDLPNMNCGACGYASCKAFAEGVINGEVTIDDCVIRGKMKQSKPPHIALNED
jgi:uncharacterized membrane protein YraQ (UPF0718 family)